uniref:Uncharacterized protein n=1 Tax=Anguilla anguilla TaxID=7936 RepID=A0A0E9P877_ANGAN
MTDCLSSNNCILLNEELNESLVFYHITMRQRWDKMAAKKNKNGQRTINYINYLKNKRHAKLFLIVISFIMF